MSIKPTEIEKLAFNLVVDLDTKLIVLEAALAADEFGHMSGYNEIQELCRSLRQTKEAARLLAKVNLYADH